MTAFPGANADRLHAFACRAISGLAKDGESARAPAVGPIPCILTGPLRRRCIARNRQRVMEGDAPAYKAVLSSLQAFPQQEVQQFGTEALANLARAGTFLTRADRYASQRMA